MASIVIRAGRTRKTLTSPRKKVMQGENDDVRQKNFLSDRLYHRVCLGVTRNNVAMNNVSEPFSISLVFRMGTLGVAGAL